MILVTGGAGFIGSNFVLDWIASGDEPVLNLDALTYAGNLRNLASLDGNPRHVFVHGDIGDRALLGDLLAKHRPRAVLNFAAESHVDRSISGPEAFLRTNVMGTLNLLESVRQHWAGLPNAERAAFRFLQVSTDEVYGSLAPDAPAFSERHRYEPNSPYAASKAGGELMVRAYHVTHGMNTVITRGSNTYGPYQYPEKLLPFFITEAMDDRPLPVYGDGKQIRDWLYVEDHVTGIDVALHYGKAGEAYNIAGEDLRHNIDVTHDLLGKLGKPETLIRHVPDREGHDRRYAMDASKLRALGWTRGHTFEQGLEDTVRWYAENAWWWRKIKTGEYLEYYQRQYAARLAAAEQSRP